MKIIEPKVELINPPTYSDPLSLIELAGRICYKSGGKIIGDSAEKFTGNILKRGYKAVVEYGSVSVRFTCDRGASYEIVRRWLASYCQENTRHRNYSKESFGGEISFARPSIMAKGNVTMSQWIAAYKQTEFFYFTMLDYDCVPQEARSTLPNNMKTEVVMTADMRGWRHLLRLRTASTAHPDMREVAKMFLTEIQTRYPTFFEDFEVWAMIVKKAGGKVYGAAFTATKKKAMEMEVNRQIIEADKRYTNDIDAMILYTLTVHLGFGPKRLKRFYEAFATEHDRLIQHYEIPDDYTWLCREELKEIGVDVEAWNRERGSIRNIREQ